MLILGLTSVDMKAQEPENQIEVICAMKDKAFTERYQGDFNKAEKTLLQALNIFSMQPENLQSEYQMVEADIYYTLARYYSLNNKANDSIKALRKAVNLGWNNYNFLAMDSELVKIRKTKAFQSIMEELRVRNTQFADNK